MAEFGAMHSAVYRQTIDIGLRVFGKNKNPQVWRVLRNRLAEIFQAA